MIIFKTGENFIGFLYFVLTAAGVIGVVIMLIIEGCCKVKRKYSEKEQSLIDGVEFAIDNRLEISKVDILEYNKLICESRQQDTEESEDIDTLKEYESNREFREYVERYLRNKEVSFCEVLQYKQMFLVAEMYREKVQADN